MENGQVLECKIFYNILGASNPCINVYHWLIEDMVGTATLDDTGADIQTAVVARHVTTMKQFQHTGCVYAKLEITNLDNFAEFYIGSLAGIAGVLGVPYFPPFVTMSMQEVRPSRSVRSGRKGVGGVSGLITADGLTLAGSYPAAMNTVLSGWNLLTFPVEGDVDFSLRDVIVHKITGGAHTDYPATRWLFNGFGSQNTRK